MSVNIELMQISSYTDNTYSQVLLGPYLMVLNPDSLHINRNIATTTNGSPATPDTLSFDVVIDCTGLVDQSRTDLPNEIATLEAILYTIDGDKRGPNLIEITWGSHLRFRGVVAQVSVTYTLFKPDGTPLRSKISFVFNTFI